MRILSSGPFDPLMGPAGCRRLLRLSASFPRPRPGLHESLGGYQIRCPKSFGKLPVDRSQQLKRVVFSAASPLELQEITGCS